MLAKFSIVPDTQEVFKKHGTSFVAIWLDADLTFNCKTGMATGNITHYMKFYILLLDMVVHLYNLCLWEAEARVS
jgi:hypothetical protein